MSELSPEERERLLAEALQQPLESINTRHRREIAARDERWELERRAARRAARLRELEREATSIDWTAHIDAVVARAVDGERERQAELLAALVAKIRDEQTDDLERATRSLTCELQDLKATMAELRVVLANERDKAHSHKSGDGTIIDLPNPLRRVN